MLADLFDGRSQLLVDPDALAVWLPRDGMTGRSSISIGARARPTDWPDPRGRFGRSARRPPPTPTWLTRGSSKSSRRKGSIPLCASWSSPDMCQRRSSAVPVSRHWVSCGWPAQAFADIHSPSHSPKARSSSSHAGLRSFRRGLENRCGPYGPPRVRIPPPPLDPARDRPAIHASTVRVLLGWKRSTLHGCRRGCRCSSKAVATDLTADAPARVVHAGAAGCAV
jgi:hypothetical protein